MPIPHYSNRRVATASLLALFTTAALSTARPAQAQLTLTSAGTAGGFSLSTFAGGFPNDSIGPLGIAFPSTGGVLVSDEFGNVRLLPTDTDGQNAASVPVAQNYGFNNPYDLAQVGGNIYMTQESGSVVQINPNGTFNQTIVDIGDATGMAANPATGHLFVSDEYNNIFDVNPITKTATSLVTGYDIDGLALSPDGKTLYGAGYGGSSSDHIFGFDTKSGAQVFDSGYISGGVDGTAAGYGDLAGNLFVNTNGGTVVEVNLATDAQTLIADGGSRGDFVTVDPTNGTLLLTQTDSIIRLTPGTGGGFAPVPEASTFVSTGLLLLGGLSLLVTARKRTRKA